MKYGSILFLKLIILLMAIVVFVGMLLFPQFEGRAKNLDLISIYWDPFILYTYIGSIPFFIGLYQVLKLIGSIEHNKFYSVSSIQSLQKIKNCALAVGGVIIGAEIFVILSHGEDDPAGFIALGIFLLLASGFIVLGTTFLGKLLGKRMR